MVTVGDDFCREPHWDVDVRCMITPGLKISILLERLYCAGVKIGIYFLFHSSALFILGYSQLLLLLLLKPVRRESTGFTT